MRFKLPGRRGPRLSPGARASAELAVSLVAGKKRPLVAAYDPATVSLIQELVPAAVVLTLPEDPRERRFLLTARRPVDVLVDLPDPDGRLERFHDTFFQVRARGTYLIPNGAGELGEEPGPLGELLRSARGSDALPLWRGGRGRKDRLLAALRDRVDVRTEGADLLLSHRIRGVKVKIREEELNDYLASTRTRHRAEVVHPIADPTPDPVGETGPVPRSARPQASSAISLRDYRDVVVAPYQVVLDGRIALPDSYRHHSRPTHAHRRLFDLEPRFAIIRFKGGADLPALEGTYLHLDDEFRGHFGHLLTETVSRVWAWPRALEIDPDAKVLVGLSKPRLELMPYELDFYEACGIPRDRVVAIESAVRVERLISGTPMFSAPYYVHPAIVDTWDEVGGRLVAGLPDREWPRRIFVSRRHGKRDCVNRDELEAVFVEHGFEILYPEDYPLGEQIQLFRAADVVAGYAGSGLFHTAFVQRPIRMIRIGPETYGARNEQLIASARGHRLDDVVCRAAYANMHAEWRYDEEREGPFLRGLLAELDG